jgi:hypothetical protein
LFWLSLTGCRLALIGLQRDRDRIVHSKAFRRLRHKTQVFIDPEGDHFRTRLTHTLEASGIARGVARALRLNKLAEIVSMILAGALASTVLRGMHFAIGGLSFGPYDTVFAAAGLLFLIGGLSAIAPMRRAGRLAADEPLAADERAAAAADTVIIAEADPGGPAVAASD